MAKAKITSDTIRTTRLRIATDKKTGEKRRLAHLRFSENKAILYGPVTEVLYDKKGQAVIFHDDEQTKTVPMDSITWEEVPFDEELVKSI